MDPFSIPETTFLTVLIGSANPTPAARAGLGGDLGVDADDLAAAVSRSGPPELPGLMAASVWMAPSMAAPLGDWIWR